MNWTHIGEVFIGMIGGGGTLVVVVGFLIRTLLDHRLKQDIMALDHKFKKDLVDYGADTTKDIERFKLAATGHQNQALEVFRSEIRAVTFEHEARFSRLQERRMSVVAETYSALVEVENALKHLMLTWRQYWRLPGEERQAAAKREEDERRKEAGKAVNAFIDLFTHNRILFDDDLCGTMQELRIKLVQALDDYSGSDLSDLPDDPETRKEAIEVRENARKYAIRDVPIVRALLETRFRQLLGVVGSRDEIPKSEKPSNG